MKIDYIRARNGGQHKILTVRKADILSEIHLVSLSALITIYKKLNHEIQVKDKICNIKTFDPAMLLSVFGIVELENV